MAELTAPSEMLQRAYDIYLSDGHAELQAGVLGLSHEECANKRILDIGSGQTNKFARAVISAVEGAIIVPVNPQLANAELCLERDVLLDDHQGSVAALAQGYLPFKAESFDTVVSVLGVPNALTSSELPTMFNDIWRVLKPGGTARLWPASYHHEPNVNAAIETPPIRMEEVNQAILEVLPEPYRSCTERILIEKPLDTSGLPEIISFLEETE